MKIQKIRYRARFILIGALSCLFNFTGATKVIISSSKSLPSNLKSIPIDKNQSTTTDLYGISVLATKPEENKIVVKVLVLSNDGQSLPKDYSFFFRILWSKGNHRAKKSGSIGHEVSTDQILDERWVDLNTYRFIKNVKQIAPDNVPLKSNSAIDSAYDSGETWANENKLVQAVYEVEVTNRKYFDHIATGMSWGTAFYETQALQVSHSHLNSLPNISNPITQLNPFKAKNQENGTIGDVLFTKDNTYFFVLSEAGELVCYRTDNWEEVWKKETKKWFGKIECDQHKKLVWVQDGSSKNNVIFNFAGKVVNEKVWPTAAEQLHKAYRSPFGNYFLLRHNSGENIKIYDAKGSLLWAYESSNKGELFPTFFENEEKLFISESMPTAFKVFDLKTGIQLNTFETTTTCFRMSIDPYNRFFSFRDAKATRIVELESKQTIFKYGTWPYNGDYLGRCIWSPNNELAAIITTGEGTRRNNGYGGYVTIYPIGIDSIKTITNSQVTPPENEFKGDSGTFVDDRDQQTYKWVRLKDGNIWMAENLNYKRVTSWCYDKNDKNCEEYGRLYNWKAAKRACPNGWHLPTDEEWREMTSHYGGCRDFSDDKGKAAYTTLMHGGTSGFSALLGGFRFRDGYSKGLGSSGVYWSCSESKPYYAWYYSFFNSNTQQLSRNDYEQSFGYSCRCIKD